MIFIIAKYQIRDYTKTLWNTANISVTGRTQILTFLWYVEYELYIIIYNNILTVSDVMRSKPSMAAVQNVLPALIASLLRKLLHYQQPGNWHNTLTEQRTWTVDDVWTRRNEFEVDSSHLCTPGQSLHWWPWPSESLI